MWLEFAVFCALLGNILNTRALKMVYDQLKKPRLRVIKGREEG